MPLSAQEASPHLRDDDWVSHIPHRNIAVLNIEHCAVSALVRLNAQPILLGNQEAVGDVNVVNTSGVTLAA